MLDEKSRQDVDTNLQDVAQIPGRRLRLWSFVCLASVRAQMRAQRKIPVDLHFIVRLRHKASGAALGLSCAVCFEQPAGVFAGCGAVCQAKILASLKIKNGISLTPLN